ncbi:hypothetical protein GCM10023170_030670 [Phytohabitans houttuyneae]|uniref:glycosyltransferase n=1 Tax=Phytohabitans houttuyneae TaxID=1076126 RepID=UPI0031E4FE19
MSADPARAPGGAGRDAGAHVLVMSNRYDTEPGAGGTEALTADLVTALTARSLRVTWLTPAAAGQQRAGAVPPPARAWREREDDQAAALAPVLGRLAPVDLVHLTHFSRTGLAFLDQPPLRHVPLVATLTDYTAVCADYQMVHRRTGDECAAPVPAEDCANCLATHPDGAAPSAAEVAGWRHRNLRLLNDRCRAVWVQTPHQGRVLVRAGLRKSLIVRDRAEYDIPAHWGPAPRSAPVVLFVGRASPEKGLHVLLEAFRQWAGAARLVVVTSADDPAYEARLRERAAADPRVEWRPPLRRGDLGALLAGAGALAVPSQWPENYPMVVHYARALGVPVVCSSVPSMEHLGQRDGVWLVDRRDDPRAWVDALDAVLSGPAGAREDRTGQFRAAYKQFVDEIAGVYATVLAGR